MKVVLERNLGFLGYHNYAVDTEGNVLNVIRGAKLINIINRHGYCMVNLSNNNKNKMLQVHRIVAIAFIPNPNKYPCVDHINTDKTDNSVKNLRWVTHKMNSNNKLTIKHISESLKNNENTRHFSVKNHQSKPILQYSKDGRFIREWFCGMDIERELGIKHGRVSACCRGIQKSAGNFIFKFKTYTHT